MSDRIYPDEHLPVMASSNNPPAGTPRENAQVNDPTCAESFADNTYWEAVPTPNAVEEARQEMISTTVDYAYSGPGGPKAYLHHVEGAADALISAVRTQAFAEVRRVVEEMERHRPFIAQTTECGAQPYLAVDDDNPEACEWINRKWTLAALDALSSEGK